MNSSYVNFFTTLCLCFALGVSTFLNYENMENLKKITTDSISQLNHDTKIIKQLEAANNELATNFLKEEGLFNRLDADYKELLKEIK